MPPEDGGMSNPILPPGIRVGSGIGTDEHPVIRIDHSASCPDGQITVTTVLSLRQARAYAALIERQTRLAEEAEQARKPVLRVLP